MAGWSGHCRGLGRFYAPRWRLDFGDEQAKGCQGGGEGSGERGGSREMVRVDKEREPSSRDRRGETAGRDNFAVGVCSRLPCGHERSSGRKPRQPLPSTRAPQSPGLPAPHDDLVDRPSTPPPAASRQPPPPLCRVAWCRLSALIVGTRSREARPAPSRCASRSRWRLDNDVGDGSAAGVVGAAR